MSECQAALSYLPLRLCALCARHSSHPKAVQPPSRIAHNNAPNCLNQKAPVDLFIEAILKLIWLPYDLWKHSNENSRIGVSEMDRANERFWLRVALVLMALVILVPLVIMLVISHYIR